MIVGSIRTQDLARHIGPAGDAVSRVHFAVFEVFTFSSSRTSGGVRRTDMTGLGGSCLCSVATVDDIDTSALLLHVTTIDQDTLCLLKWP